MTKNKHFLTRDREFYRQILSIAIPIALQNLINFSVVMADTLMLGSLGEPQLAAANLANKFGTIYTLFTFGLGGGANVLIAQFWGKGDKDAIKKIMTIMYRALFVGGLLFSAIAIFFPVEAMKLFSNDPMVQKYGVEYLKVIGFSYLIAGMVSTTTILFRSVGSLKISLIVYISSLVTNVFLNWVFIFGNLGAPALGMTGGAIGTLGARIVEGLILLIYMAFFEKKIGYKFKDIFLNVSSYLESFKRHATPVIINEIIWGTGFTIISIIIGRMGTAFTAADSVVSVLSQLVTIFIWGVGHASAVIIGNTIGAGKEEKAKEYARTFMVLSLVLGVISSIIVLLLKNPMISLFNITPIGKEYAGQVISAYAIIVVFQAISGIGLIGVLRGSGNSKYVLIMDLIFMWLISIPLGYIAGLKLGLPIFVVYFILRADEIFKAGAAIVKIIKGDWIKNVTNI